jgi:transcriptional regulator with PAS, ATPase and Fis domain
VKLLRVLQERNFERLGGESTIAVDLRLVAATKVPLRDMVRENRFREDLFYRINVVPVLVPPLRERRGDVPLLVEYLIQRYGKGRRYAVARSAMSMLERYPWPGNVRELENAVQRAIALAGSRSELAQEDLLPQDSRWRGAVEVPEEVRPLREVVRAAEVAHIQRALEMTGGHRSQTADILGISRKVLWEKIRDFGIEVPGGQGESEP